MIAKPNEMIGEPIEMITKPNEMIDDPIEMIVKPNEMIIIMDKNPYLSTCYRWFM